MDAENLIRNNDGTTVTNDDIGAAAAIDSIFFVNQVKVTA